MRNYKWPNLDVSEERRETRRMKKASTDADVKIVFDFIDFEGDDVKRSYVLEAFRRILKKLPEQKP